jgi:hypothetical protein
LASLFLRADAQPLRMSSGGNSNILASDAFPGQVTAESKVRLSDGEILANNPELASIFEVLDVSNTLAVLSHCMNYTKLTLIAYSRTRKNMPTGRRKRCQDW